MRRELDSLKSALEYFEMKEGVIVIHNQTDLFEDEGVTIKLRAFFIPFCDRSAKNVYGFLLYFNIQTL